MCFLPLSLPPSPSLTLSLLGSCKLPTGNAHLRYFKTAAHKLRINRQLSLAGVDANINIIIVIVVIIILGLNRPLPVTLVLILCSRTVLGTFFLTHTTISAEMGSHFKGGARYYILNKRYKDK